MGFPSSAPLPLARLAGVGAVVFLANAALLVLQLVASRLLAPFIGSDLYTWTSIIGVFLAGIALGNAYGGRLADRYPTPWALVVLLAAGALAAVWMLLFPMLLTQTGLHRSIPLAPRIPLLSAVLCLPAGVTLSLLTPLAIKLGLPDVSRTGRVAGMVFALSTLGCLLGNYVTGFYLVPAFTINDLVLVAAAVLMALAFLVFAVLKVSPPDQPAPPAAPAADAAPAVESARSPAAFTDIRQAFAVVFLASFCGMTLELTASRLLAQHLGVSLYTWTGIIGVMLAGTALGNLTGGWLADRANRSGSALDPRNCLAATLMSGGAATVFIFVSMAVITRFELMEESGLIQQVLGWTFALFFLPMFVLGMVSPQVIRLAVPDVAHAGRVAGRVYAVSTLGAIVGTFATGYVLVSTFGVNRTILGAATVLTLTSLGVVNVWLAEKRSGLLLYLFSIVMGGVTGGFILTGRSAADEDTVAELDTNYYRIKVSKDIRHTDDGTRVDTGALKLTLDHLVHSSVHPTDPTFIYYEHEHIQMEFLRAARAHTPTPKALVIGGGGYTFPRFAKTLQPETELDVVEIDPGVTRAAYQYLGLQHRFGPDDKYGIHNFNMDGRQYVAERAAPHSYDLIVQDAVNDLSVPAHLLTKEYNDEVKAALAPGGVYLLTIIDEVEHGKLWRASMATLRKTFPHVALLTPNEYMVGEPPPGKDEKWMEKWRDWQQTWPEARQVYVIYAADRPLDVAALRAATNRAVGYVPGGENDRPEPLFFTQLVPDAKLEPYLTRDPGVILTDQFAPVDNLMAEVFRRR